MGIQLGRTNAELLIMKELGAQGIRICLKPSCPNVITPSLINEIRDFQDSLANQYFSCPWEGCLYIFWYYHRRHGMAKRGLDFNYILQCIQKHQESKLEAYIANMFNLLFLNYIGLGLPIINCSIVGKKISGIFQDFFYLNRVNFIKKFEVNPDSTESSRINVFDVANQLLFHETIYQNNIYYHCPSFDLNQMKQIIENTKLNLFDNDKIKDLSACFEEQGRLTWKKYMSLPQTILNC